MFLANSCFKWEENRHKMNGDWKIANIPLPSPAKADKSSSIDKLLVIYRGLKILTAPHKLRALCLALGPRAAGMNWESGQEQELGLQVLEGDRAHIRPAVQIHVQHTRTPQGSSTCSLWELEGS